MRSIAIDNKKNKPHTSRKNDEVDLGQISLFDTLSDEDVLQELKEIDCNNLTPMEALNTLNMLQNKLKNRW